MADPKYIRELSEKSSGLTINDIFHLCDGVSNLDRKVLLGTIIERVLVELTEGDRDLNINDIICNGSLISKQPNWGPFIQAGKKLNIVGPGQPDLCLLNESNKDIAYIDAAKKNLSVYRWSGSSWSLQGTPLNIYAGGMPGLCLLNEASSDIAYIDEYHEILTIYHWSGYSWSLRGTPLNIPGIGRPRICILDKEHGDIAFMDYSLGDLTVYHAINEPVPFYT